MPSEKYRGKYRIPSSRFHDRIYPVKLSIGQIALAIISQGKSATNGN